MRAGYLPGGGHVPGQPGAQGLVGRQVRAQDADRDQVRERGLPEVQRPQGAVTAVDVGMAVSVAVAQALAQPERANPRRIPGLKLRHLNTPRPNQPLTAISCYVDGGPASLAKSDGPLPDVPEPADSARVG